MEKDEIRFSQAEGGPSEFANDEAVLRNCLGKGANEWIVRAANVI